MLDLICNFCSLCLISRSNDWHSAQIWLSWRKLTRNLFLNELIWLRWRWFGRQLDDLVEIDVIQSTLIRFGREWNVSIEIENICSRSTWFRWCSNDLVEIEMNQSTTRRFGRDRDDSVIYGWFCRLQIHSDEVEMILSRFNWFGRHPNDLVNLELILWHWVDLDEIWMI